MAESEERNKNKLLVIILAISSIVAGLATFKTNLLTLMGPPKEQERVVLKRVGSKGNFSLSPTDPDVTVQGVCLSFPKSLVTSSEPECDPDGNYSSQADALAVAFWRWVGPGHDINRRSDTKTNHYCEGTIMVKIDVDFIGKDSERHTSSGIYVLGFTTRRATTANLETLAYLNSIEFDHFYDKHNSADRPENLGKPDLFRGVTCSWN